MHPTLLQLKSDIEIPASIVINTLPLTLSMRMLEPSPPPELCAVADTIKYRHLVLCRFLFEPRRFFPECFALLSE